MSMKCVDELTKRAQSVGARLEVRGNLVILTAPRGYVWHNGSPIISDICSSLGRNWLVAACRTLEARAKLGLTKKGPSGPERIEWT